MEKIRIALIGCGGIQGKHWRTFAKRQDVKVVALVDVTQEAIDGFIQRMEIDSADAPKAFTDAAAMYQQIKPDAVSIATPHTMHFAHAMAAIEAGCHVLMEKPMVTSAQDARMLDAAVKKSGKVLVVGYNTPCKARYQYIRNLIRDKKLGKLEMACGYLTQGWMKAQAGTWRQNPALSGGGQAYDSGAHILNSLCWTVESRVKEVFTLMDNHGTAVDINSSINIKFENGVFASIVISGNCPANGAHMVYIFENGKIEISPWTASDMKVYEGNELVPEPEGLDQQIEPGDNFLDAIAGKAQISSGTEDGIIQSELMDAIYQSAQTGKPVIN